MEPELRRTKKFPLLPRPLFLGQAVHTRLASSLAVGKGNCSHREAGGRLSTDVPLVTSRLTTSKLFDRTYLPIPERPFSFCCFYTTSKHCLGQSSNKRKWLPLLARRGQRQSLWMSWTIVLQLFFLTRSFQLRSCLPRTWVSFYLGKLEAAFHSPTGIS